MALGSFLRAHPVLGQVGHLHPLTLRLTVILSRSVHVRYHFLRGVVIFAVGFSQAFAQQPPAGLTSQEDHARMLKLLGITELRHGADGRNP